MTEKLGVDSAFGYRAAVYGDVLGVLACAVLMYYLRKKLLARAAFAGYEHRQVDRGHAQRALDCGGERRSVSNDSESGLGLLYFS